MSLRTLGFRDRHGEHGFVLVWMAIMITTLMATAALAVEFHNLSRVGTRMQKAVDAASLGGVVYLPENFDPEGDAEPGDADAVGRALELTALNGFENEVDGSIITVDRGLTPSQLEVCITKTVPNALGNMIGVSPRTISRCAIAEYNRPLAMGSPQNQYANDPESTDPTGFIDGGFPNVWGSIGGNMQGKNAGEPVSPEICRATPGVLGSSYSPDNCEGGIGGVNQDYSADGYFYAVDVLDNPSDQDLVVQVMDAGFVGPNACNAGALGGANTLAPDFNPTALPNWASDPITPAERYAPGGREVTRFCVGDQPFGDPPRPTWTTWRVREPGTSHDPAQNATAPGCERQLPGRHTGIEAKNIRDMLLETTPHATPEGTASALFASYFRHWYTICTIPNAEPGTYYIQVQTKTTLTGSPAPEGDGHNRFALRAGLGDPKTPDNVHVSGYGRMSLAFLIPSEGGTSQFYLTRVEPSDRDRDLVLRFYDVGDCAPMSEVNPNGCTPGTMRVVPPPEYASEFTGCTYQPAVGRQPTNGPPWNNPEPTPLPNCAIDGIILNFSSTGWDAKWVEVVIPIPEDYDCDPDVTTQCWVRIEFTYPDGAGDTTVWTAEMRGHPARLIS